MKILALETSGKTGSIALLHGNSQAAELVVQVELPADRRSAQSLLPTIHQTLAKQGWTPNDVELISVVTGPGSFTGLRVGVTTAKTLSYAMQIPLVEVNTLAALAQAVTQPAMTEPARTQPYGRLWCVLDAQRRELFAACFIPGASLIEQAEGNSRLLSIDDFLQQVQEGDLVCGEPIEKLLESLPKGVIACKAGQAKPPANAVGELGYQLYLQDRTVDVLQLIPQYGRRSAAEEKAAE